MEVIINQWNGEENEVEEVSMQRRRGLKHSSSSDMDIDVQGGGLDFDESEMKSKIEVNGTQVNGEMILQQKDIENSTILPASDLPPHEDSTSLSNVTNGNGTVSIIKVYDQERHEFYLERVFQKPPTHGFYCPNCNACIQKVYIQKGEWEEQTSASNPQPLQPTVPIRCTSCFSFLIPIGSWLFPGWVPNEDEALNNQATAPLSNKRVPEGPEQTPKVAPQHEAPEQPDQSEEVKQTLQNTEEVVLLGQGPKKLAREVEYEINGTGLGSILGDNAGNNKKSQDSSDHLSSATSQDTFLDQTKGQVARRKEHFWSDWAVIGGAFSEASVPKQHETGPPKNSDWKAIDPVYKTTIPKQPQSDFPDKKKSEPDEVIIDGLSTGPAGELVPSGTETPLLTRMEPRVPASSNKTLEILKSMVYGGLTESLASLSVVTSAASADATTLNIVVLAIANLIGGIFTLGHSLRELKADDTKRADAAVDRYNELLGQRENFFFHAFIAILSFIVFGLVPPVVYGFSFRESDEKDFKLAAVAGASLLCITLLSIAKAYVIKRPNNSYLTYFQTVLYYVTTGTVASVLSYLAGDMVKKLLERLGLFESASSNLSLKIPGISTGWGSY